jgi:hypothetical protein
MYNTEVSAARAEFTQVVQKGIDQEIYFVSYQENFFVSYQEIYLVFFGPLFDF